MRILDLFCGAGGAAMGYHRAFPDAEIVVVDIAYQPRYPFTFVQADAMTFDLEGFDFIHASPPCQLYSASTAMHDKSKYPDLVGPVRERLAATGVAYVIENVPGAPLLNWMQVCGSGLGMVRLRRHRRFESNCALLGAPCAHGQNRNILAVAGHSEQGEKYKTWRASDRRGDGYLLADRRRAMGIDWMNVDELSEAIPPAYTQFIGEQLRDQLEVAA